MTFAYAEELTPRAKEAIERRVKRDVVEEKTFDGSLSQALIVPPVDWKSQFVVQGTTKENVTGEARLAGTITYLAESPVLLDLRIRGPINKETKAAELANLDGLVNSVTADFGLGTVIWSPNLGEIEANAACAQFWCDTRRAEVFCFEKNLPAWRQRSDAMVHLEHCIEHLEKYPKTPEAEECRKQLAEKRQTLDDLKAALTLLSSAPEPSADCLREVEPAARTYMSTDECHAAVRKFQPPFDPSRHLYIQAFNRKFVCQATEMELGSVYRARLRAAVREVPPLLFSIRAAVGREDFDFVDKDTLKKDGSSETNFRFTGAAGALIEPVGLVTATYRFERTHKAGPETTLCNPIGMGGSTTCNDVRLGATTMKTHNQLQIAVRRFFGRQFAIDPRYVYDANEGISALEMPIYFLTNKDNGLTGGISVGWRSDTDDVTASLFVGAALTLFDGPWQNPFN
jgi:hypothetical protein